MISQKYLDELTYEILGSAIEVHKIMGKGLLESVYHQCLKEEFNHRKINFLTEMKVPVVKLSSFHLCGPKPKSEETSEDKPTATRKRKAA